MRTFLYKIFHSEFLTFSEVLRLKVTIVNMFLIIFVFLSIPFAGFNDFVWSVDLIVPLSIVALLGLSFILVIFNLSRFAMHMSIWTILLLTAYYAFGSTTLFTFMLFFISLTIIIFYQDILSYLIYGVISTLSGVMYIYYFGDLLAGINSYGAEITNLTYQIILVSFFVVFFIQLLVSDNIYEKLSSEWVKMNKYVNRYQDISFTHLNNILSDEKKAYDSEKFQKIVMEISTFMNSYFDDEAEKIIEVVEFFFTLHHHDVEQVINDSKLPTITRKYANELKKYLMNANSEMTALLFDFNNLLQVDNNYDSYRYNYNLDEINKNRIDKLLSLAILYKFLKTEVTQKDKWGQIERKLTHDEISQLFTSKEFREFLSYEQIKFFTDNEEIFNKYL